MVASEAKQTSHVFVVWLCWWPIESLSSRRTADCPLSGLFKQLESVALYFNISIDALRFAMSHDLMILIKCFDLLKRKFQIFRVRWTSLQECIGNISGSSFVNECV